MADDTWLIIHTPTGVMCWDLGLTPPGLEALINAARLAAGVPPTEAWVDDSSFTIAITFGTPHPTLLAKATVGQLSDLQKADPVAVQTYAAQRATNAQQMAVASVKAAYQALTPTEQAAVIAP